MPWLFARLAQWALQIHRNGTRPRERRRPRALVVGVVAAPGISSDLGAELRPDLAERIAVRLPDAEWTVRLVSDRLVEWPADLSQLIAAGHCRMLDEGWDLAVCITDLPLQDTADGRPQRHHRRPVPHRGVPHGNRDAQQGAASPAERRQRQRPGHEML
jgi:hypothetical protein